MTLIGVLAFFGKVLVVCWFQAFVRWTPPALPLRPADEARLAGAPPGVAREHPRDGGRLAGARPGRAAASAGAQGRGRRDAGARRGGHRVPRRPRRSSACCARASTSATLVGSSAAQRREARAARRPRRCRPERQGAMSHGDATFPKKPARPPTRSSSSTPSATSRSQSYLPEIFRGVGVSMKHFFDNTREMVRGERPDPVLERYDDGITHHLLSGAEAPVPRALPRHPPADARARTGARAAWRASAAPRRARPSASSSRRASTPRATSGAATSAIPVKFVIDELRCIFCGYCVEACPCDAIRMDTGMHAVPYDSRDQFIYERDLLMAFRVEGRRADDREPAARAGRRDAPGDRPRAPGALTKTAASVLLA